MDRAMNRQCQTCIHWRPANRATAYSAPCELSYGRTAHSDGCASHEPPTPEMQSQTRGLPWIVAKALDAHK